VPFKSKAQRRYLWMKHPDVARKRADEAPGQKDLPMHKDEPKKAMAQVMAKRKRVVY